MVAHNDEVELNGNLQNSLILSGDEAEKYLLPSDIVANDLEDSFIVLSACSTFTGNRIDRNKQLLIFITLF